MNTFQPFVFVDGVGYSTLSEYLLRFPQTEQSIHHVSRYYNNPKALPKQNFVRNEHLRNHVKYNLENRPGTALFVDSHCVSVGYLGDERCVVIQRQLIENPVTSDLPSSLPYN
jgi:hypothetical protein